MLKKIFKRFDDGIKKAQKTGKELEKLQATIDGECEWGLEKLCKQLGKDKKHGGESNAA